MLEKEDEADDDADEDGCLAFLVLVMSFSSSGKNPFVLFVYSCRAFMSTFVRHMGHLCLVVSAYRDWCRHLRQKQWPVSDQYMSNTGLAQWLLSVPQ